MKGQYVVYERALKEEESLFLDIARKVVAEVNEPASWKKPKDPKKRGGGRPYEYGWIQADAPYPDADGQGQEGLS